MIADADSSRLLAVSQLEDLKNAAPLAADGASRAGTLPESPSACSARITADSEALGLLQGLVASDADAGPQGASRPNSIALEAAFADVQNGAAAASQSGLVDEKRVAHLAQLVEDLVGSEYRRQDAEAEDVISQLLALEQRHDAQETLCQELLWRNAGSDDEPIATPAPLGDAIETLHEVRQSTMRMFFCQILGLTD